MDENSESESAYTGGFFPYLLVRLGASESEEGDSFSNYFLDLLVIVLEAVVILF